MGRETSRIASTADGRPAARARPPRRHGRGARRPRREPATSRAIPRRANTSATPCLRSSASAARRPISSTTTASACTRRASTGGASRSSASCLERTGGAPQRRRLHARRHRCLPHLRDRYIDYPEEIVAALARKARLGAAAAPALAFAITCGGRLDLFRRTVNSFLRCCRDLDRVAEWICIGDGWAGDGRRDAERLYPFFAFHWLDTAGDRAGGLDILPPLMRSPWVIHVEAGWQFFEAREYCTLPLEIFAERPEIDQVRFNRDRAEATDGGFNNDSGEAIDDAQAAGWLLVATRGGRPYALAGGEAANLHFSCGPSMLRRRIWDDVDPFGDSAPGGTEADYETRCARRTFRSAAFDGTYCVRGGTCAAGDAGFTAGEQTAPLRVKLIADWCTSREICDVWNKMSQGGYRWNDLEITWTDDDVDYYAIINRAARGEAYRPQRTIVFPMEPAVENQGGPAAAPDPRAFLQVRDHRRHRNTTEWHLGKTYAELKAETPVKTRLLSAVVSSRYAYPGHRKRIDFLRFLEARGVRLDIFGWENAFGFAAYVGALPAHAKDRGLLPYKYTINAENRALPNYFTEKITDAILAECLCFYWGCPNLGEHLDPRAYIALDLDDLEASYRVMMAAIEGGEWERRIDVIRREKRRILDELQFFPTLHALIRRHRVASRALGGEHDAIKEIDHLVARYTLEGGLDTRGDPDIVAYFRELFPAAAAGPPARTLLLLGDPSEAGRLSGAARLAERCATVVDHDGQDQAPAEVARLYGAPVSYRCGSRRIVIPRDWVDVDRRVPVKVINLDRRPDRWRAAARALSAAGLSEVCRVAAVDGQRLDGSEEDLALFRDNSFGSRRGVIGCALSHIGLWRVLAAEPAGSAAYLVLEDDVALAGDFLGQWGRRHDEVVELDPKWDLIYLGMHCHPRPGAAEGIEPRVARLARPPAGMIGGTFAYALRRSGALKLLGWIAGGGMPCPVDTYIMARLSEMRAYAVTPAIAFSDFAGSGGAVDSDVQYDFAAPHAHGG